MDILRQKKRFILVFVIVLLLSMFVLRTPKPLASNVEDKFSAVRASEHIEVISRKPHSYYDREELEEVKDYLVNTLSNYFGNANVTEIDYSIDDMKAVMDESEHPSLLYPITNVLAKLPGTNEEGILLVAHYDSRGHVGRAGELGRSYGAMDDGYGVGALLELAYIFKDLNPTNSIYFLFTDAEEVGLYGAIMASKDNDVMKDIKFIINVESRGRFGPSYMFETSKNNDKVIDLYKKADFPVSYSMATAVYSVMPNFTDFTPLMETNIPGLNFATLAGLDNYHSPLDAYENINQSSIQHIGEQIEPVVREFAGNDKYIQDNYFKANNDKVFFTIFAHILVSYKQITAIILIVLATLTLIGLIVYKVRRNELEKGIVKKRLTRGLLVTLILVIAGYIFSNIVAFIGKVPFGLTYTRVTGADFPTLIFMVLVFLMLVRQIKNSNSDHILLMGTTINIVLGLITTFLLPGASFLFTITGILGLVVMASEYVEKSCPKTLMNVIPYLILFLIIIPLLWSFYMALTVGGVAILVLLLVINSTVSIPAILNHYGLA